MDVADHPTHLVKDMPGGDGDPPTKFQPCIVILGIFLLVGMAAGHAYPAHLVEDVPGGKLNPPSQFHPNLPMYCNFW